MGLTLLVDADIVAFKFASVTEKVHYFDGADSEPAVTSDFEAAKEGASNYLEEMRERLGADKLIICLSDPDKNFRKDVWPLYKANRKSARKPTDLMNLKLWFAEKYQTYQRPALEADDCMGILGTHPALVRGDKVIVSEDKDLQSVGPAWLYNPRKDTKPRRISKLQADRYHLWQTIVGDTSDGYPGAPGIGPKSDEAIMVLASKTVQQAWGYVLDAYARSKKIPKDSIVESATVMARLARILRSGDWDFSRKAPRLWTPPALSGYGL